MPTGFMSVWTTRPSIVDKVRRAGKSRQLDEAESMIREPRLIDLDALALEDIDIAAGGRAEIIDIQRAILAKRLGVTKLNRRARRAGDLQSAPADHVLAQIVNPHARRNLVDGFRPDRFGDPHRLHHLRRQFSLGRLDRAWPLPTWNR